MSAGCKVEDDFVSSELVPAQKVRLEVISERNCTIMQTAVNFGTSLGRQLFDFY